MRKLFMAFGAIALAAIIAGCTNKIPPAEGLRLACEAFASQLTILAPLRADGALPPMAVTIVDTQKDAVDPICTGPAPDINADVKQIAVESGVKVLTGIATQFLGGK